ncbi:PREDICTED: hexose carrier protein HEX6-like isoform X1 [Ipomoea nil]|uniref:hexose carrier protein HEX6-like isoform X1 n=1 Tax=Ipomoea nil TaxID=35883 RepID=UPI000901DE75|nr:PREDICTED: hexose carrier protein HEX6-like isoform X1 [Ipomoea nil]
MVTLLLLAFYYPQYKNPCCLFKSSPLKSTEKIQEQKTTMAVGMSITNEPGNYNGRMTSFVVLSCMMAAMGGLIFGYDIGISGGVTSMEPFLKRFFHDVYTKMKEDSAEVSNYCKFDSQLLTLFTSSLYVSGLFASLLASSVTRACGRTPSILIGGVAFLAGAALGGAAINVYMLILGRVLLGIGIGFANQAVPLYLSEMAPAKYRGGININFQMCVGSGVLIANLINYGTEKIRDGWGWRISLGLAAVPAAMLTLGGIFLPETANSLIQRRNDHDRAKRRLQRVRGTDDVQAELDDLVAASEASRTIKRPFKNILQRRYRPQLVMSIAIPFFQQVTGINVIASYAPVLFRTIGLGESASLMSAVVTGAVGLFTTFVSMLIVDKLGRRRVLIIGGILMFVTQMAVGGVMAAKLGNHGGLTKGWAVVVLLLICIYDAGFGFSWGPLGWLIPSEIFPLEIRSAGQSITVAVNFFFTFLVGQTFLAMLCHFKYGIFFFYGGWVSVMTTFVYFLLPETKNMPIEKMDIVWREHWFWKKFAEVESHLWSHF